MKTKLTIAYIREATRQNSPHFFDRDTLKFFGQRMSSFRVWKGKSGATYIAAPMRHEDRHTGRFYTTGLTLRKFTGADLELVEMPNDVELLGMEHAKEWLKQNG